MRVEVWADVVCPWCYIGKRRLEKALARFDHACQVEVVWRSFQLDPSVPKGFREPVHEYLAKKTRTSIAQAREMTDHVKALAAQEGLAFDTDRTSVVNTFAAHRLIQLAKRHDRLEQMYERLMRAYHVEGETVDDPQTLVRLGAEVGVPAEEAEPVLAGEAYAPEVEADIREAAALGATGVPFFVFDRAYRISGAQPVETFLSTLRTAYDGAGTPAR